MGVQFERQEEVGQIIAEDVAVWAAGVELVLEEFSKSGMLPGRVYLCGGGSRLPQIGDALRDSKFARSLPFARPPQVEAIIVSDVAQVTDMTELLVDEQDIPPMALAHQALEMSAPEAPLDGALRRVLRQMKV
jgi:cell division protein FtsA